MEPLEKGSQVEADVLGDPSKVVRRETISVRNARGQRQGKPLLDNPGKRGKTHTDDIDMIFEIAVDRHDAIWESIVPRVVIFEFLRKPVQAGKAEPLERTNIQREFGLEGIPEVPVDITYKRAKGILDRASSSPFVVGKESIIPERGVHKE